MKKKKKEILNFNKIVKLYSETKEEGKLSKFDHKLKAQMEAFKTVNETYAKDVTDLKIDHCSEDDRKNLIFDLHGNYTFTKANIKLLNTAIAALGEQEIEIDVRLTVQDLEGCPEPFKTLFAEFIGVSEETAV